MGRNILANPHRQLEIAGQIYAGYWKFTLDLPCVRRHGLGRKQGRVILKVGAAESPAAVQNLAISRCFV